MLYDGIQNENTFMISGFFFHLFSLEKLESELEKIRKT